ncbi:class I SAM-dependent DNA methyltransferase [Streptomyces griseoaurantiacus]|uniref:Eco57I restriction-modification methylase domain-containing protein n=1 Tax=Streptomyces griseoaurantiacus TaxID=68213 RepID=UPI00352E490E
MKFDALTNEGEYFPPFYLDEILPKQLRTGRLKEWTAGERQGRPTPRQGLRDLTGPYLDVRLGVGGEAEKYNPLPDAGAIAAQQSATEALKAHANPDGPPAFQPATTPRVYDETPEGAWRAGLNAWHVRVLKALGFTPVPGHLTVHSAAASVAVPVAHSEPGIVVLTGGFADDVAATRGDGSANRLAVPVRVASGKTLTTVTDLAAWLLSANDAPRYALLLFGGIIVLADRENFARGRHLAVSLEVALPRKGLKGATAGELDVIAALFGAQSLRPAQDGGDDDIARLVAESRDHSVGVTSDLREGLKKSVQLIANEVLELAGRKGVRPDDLPEWLPGPLADPGALPRLLTKESLRYLYRILFLLYAEARPELDILPMKSPEYTSGYSVGRLRELVVQEKLSSASRDRHHFHDSLALLFKKVFTGHPVAETVTSRDSVADVDTETPELAEEDGYAGVRIEALRSRLFDPKSIRLVDQVIVHPADKAPDGTIPATARRLDLRLRNKVLHQVLRNLTLVEGRGRGGRGGFISYANLDINHLGAVYEGLMSYTGFIADEPLYEVAKGGDPSGGSWLIKASQVASGRYPNDVFVGTERDPQTNALVPVPRKVDSYVYRLAGRDRETSASYYTPKSLTEATVEQTLRFRLDEKGEVDPKEPEKAWINAADVLNWRVCEPALGSGAFLNEAVNQLAELYLKLAERERGVEIDPEDYQRELQKVKAYIALHNAYGVDLNETAVELAEISLWLNTMHRGMKAPWYGLHLHRGNSLIGAARKVYPGNSLSKGGWLTSKDPQRPRHAPLTEKLKAREVHQFLLPAMGWGSIGEKVSVRTLNKGTSEEAVKAVVDGKVVDWLEPELVEALRKWRSAMRRNPKGDPRRAPAPKKKAAPTPEKQAEKDEALGQGAFDLGLEIWEQPTLGISSAAAGSGGTGGRSGASRVTAAAAPAKSGQDDDEEPGARTQTGRLIGLARRVEYLWDLVVMRLRLSEQEISRRVDVWGAAAPREGEGGAGRRPPMDRDAVLKALQRKGTPYWRLKQVMDAWCALWFWPLEEIGLLDGTDEFQYRPNGEDRTALPKGHAKRKVALKSLDDWIEFAEAVLGRVDVDTGEGPQASLLSFGGVKDLRELDEKEKELDWKMTEETAWSRPADLGDTFPWYESVQRIAEERGFFHWELNFAHVFAEGGFDLMVGNPPWVRQEWDENGVLAEAEPWFVLGGKDTEADREWNVAEVLSKPENRSFYLGELGTVAGVSEFLSSADTYPELVGTRPDMYRAFMLLAWRATGTRGTTGLIHPATHLTGGKEGALRRAAYEHLRLHADFANERKLFGPPVHHSTHFSMNVYGRSRTIQFEHVNWLFLPGTLSQSLKHDNSGPVPGIVRDETWDVHPHRKRITVVTESVLAAWQELLNDEDADTAEAKALFPVTTDEDSAVAALAKWAHRLGVQAPRISPGFNETKDRAPETGFFTWKSGDTKSWREVILQPRFFSLATPLTAQPSESAAVTADMEPWDLEHLAEEAVPRTHYRPVSDWTTYARGLHRREWCDGELLTALRQDDRVRAEAEALVADEQLSDQAHSEAVDAVLRHWATRPWTDFYRVAWRRRTPSDYARNLTPALVPPGSAHIHQVHSLAMADNQKTALVAGFWSSLPLEYFLRITERDDLQVREAEVMPAPTPGHPLTGALLLRILRLNCQTSAYARLWEELYDPSWQQDTWAASGTWPETTPPLVEGVGPTWSREIPLRTEFSRRAALVEIDALVAVWLEISAEQLEAMYVARFPAMRRQEENMWFDSEGRRIAKKHQVFGYGQPKDAWKKLSSHEDFPNEYTLPDGYTGPLYRAHREAEMKAAHAEFTLRTREA